MEGNTSDFHQISRGPTGKSAQGESVGSVSKNGPNITFVFPQNRKVPRKILKTSCLLLGFLNPSAGRFSAGHEKGCQNQTRRGGYKKSHAPTPMMFQNSSENKSQGRPHRNGCGKKRHDLIALGPGIKIADEALTRRDGTRFAHPHGGAGPRDGKKAPAPAGDKRGDTPNNSASGDEKNTVGPISEVSKKRTRHKIAQHESAHDHAGLGVGQRQICLHTGDDGGDHPAVDVVKEVDDGQ